jgi:hypothetical protein
VKSKTFVFLLFTLLCSSYVISNHVTPVRAQSSGELKVTRVVWGTDPNTPANAYPGDTQSPLTVELQNLDQSATIKGVTGLLKFPDGRFTDIYGNPNATATGTPTVGDLLSPTDEIQPKGFLTMTFTLDIGEDVVAGTYKYNMETKYSVQQGNIFVDGTPQILVVQIVISKIDSTITVSITPQTAEKGQAVRISGTIAPAIENATVILVYKKPDSASFSRTVRTNADGSFAESYMPDAEGFWSVNASWLGDSKYASSWASTTFEIRLPVSLSVSTINNRLIGGVDNQFNITIQNNGAVPVSALDITLTVPSPLVFRGENHWTLNYLEPGNTTLIPVFIYSPSSAIGTTYSSTLDVNYQDDYGASQTDSFPLGIVVVGRIELVIYDKSVSPQPAINGSRIEITTTLLNKGNVVAMYVNASIQPSTILSLTSESTTYIGDVEENSQSPFTLATLVKNNAESGTYPIKIWITYRDDQYVDHSLDATVYVTVEAQAEAKPVSEGGENFFAPLGETGLILLVIVVASVVILLLYRRSMSKRRSLSNAGQIQ